LVLAKKQSSDRARQTMRGMVDWDAKHEPSNKLTTQERQRIIKVANEPAYADLPPNKIVPKLADKGITDYQ
jgi:hypothetical protein